MKIISQLLPKSSICLIKKIDLNPTFKVELSLRNIALSFFSFSLLFLSSGSEYFEVIFGFFF